MVLKINTYQSYPIESEKGRYIGMFWGIFNTVGVRMVEWFRQGSANDCCRARSLDLLFQLVSLSPGSIML